MGRKCPICGAANYACKGNHDSDDGVIITEAEKVKGPLVTIEIKPGLGVKMGEEQARKLGLLPEEKERKKASNKARKRSKTKAEAEAE